MRSGEPGRVHAAINVTPLVDVVLVLLIIFMVIAPQLAAGGPPVDLPTTDEPPSRAEDGSQIVVAIEQGGAIWVDREQMTGEVFERRIREAAAEDAERQVVIQGDARLPFGEIERMMLAIEAAGFSDVGLIAAPREAAGRKG
jgi:biopolymer transport protein ExbD